MKRKPKVIRLGEGGIELIRECILSESYSDKVDLVRKYLDSNFTPCKFDKNGEETTIFIKKVNNKPTGKSLWREDVFDELERKFEKILSDKENRDGFLNQVLNDWASGNISKYGSLSNYKW